MRALGRTPTTIKSNNPGSARAGRTQPAPRLRLERTLGNLALQAKLRVSQPGDPYEQEADRVADTVMRMPAPQAEEEESPCATCAGGGSTCPKCAARSAGRLQRKTDGAGAAPSRAPDAVLAGLGPGRPLDAPTRSFFEPRFGRDLSPVRVHTDTRAAESARAVSALAYTVGRDVVFADGAYAPQTSAGRRLMAHELTHVMQQGGAGEGNGNVVHRALAPTIMRTAVFSSTMEICHRLLESRTFHVSEGGIRVTASAAYERRGEPECSSHDYHMTLNDDSFIFSEYGTCDFPQGEPFSRQWTNLPTGDYHLTIWTNNTNPYCCLVGDIAVEQQSGLEGESCTRPPPGPLEILHTALDLAGLIPALGAVPDAINAGIYLIEGDWLNAGLSAVAIVPIFGDAASVARVGTRTVVRITGEGIERVGREGIEAGLREARASRSAAGHAAEDLAGSSRRIDPDIDEMVERGIIEESSTTTGPVRRPRPATPTVRGAAEAAREAFDRVRDGFARRLGVGAGGQVHHAIELQALDRYPGVFRADELNDFANMRGIATELANRRQLHNSSVRRMWDRHYRQLDAEIAERGLMSGTEAYNDYVRRYVESARDEIDYTLGQFFTEYRSALDWTPTP